MYRIHPSGWEAINRRHRAVLARHVIPSTSILEVGCGWGRLLDLLPPGYRGRYLGVDLSPDFIALARTERKAPNVSFICGDAVAVLPVIDAEEFDLGVVVSIKNMLVDNGKADVWDRILGEMRRRCRRVLVLEYDPDGDGEVVS